jgi:uncharacterized protein (DUF885 family)
MRGYVDAQIATDVCRGELWFVDQLNGLQVGFSSTIATSPLGTPESERRMLRGAYRMPEAVRRSLVNLRAGLAAGYAAPRANVERVIAQLNAMLDSNAASLDAPAHRDSAAAFAAQWRAAVRDSVLPALRSYRDFLANDYLSKARPEPGLTSLPNGRACYAAIVWSATTLQPDLDSLYATAVAQRTKVQAEILPLGRAIFGPNATLLEILRRIRTDSALVMHDPDSIVAAYKAALNKARSLLPLQFAKIPDGPIVVQAIPQTMAAAAAPARYEHAPADGSAPAIFFVNAYQPGGIAKMNIPLGAAHEGYPGHHFQFLYAALARAADGGPDFLSNGAYLEGWGIYAERLADESGLYSDPVTRLGYLVHALDVWMALQADIGMHARGWTRQQTIDTMMVVAGRPQPQAASYADRSAATPGQLATYGIGVLVILRARSDAQLRMGSKFDLKGFHAVVLGDGSVTLPELERRVAEWAKANSN